jgi:hypothetical protein
MAGFASRVGCPVDTVRPSRTPNLNEGIMSYPPAGPPPSGGPFAPPAATSTAPPPYLGFPVNVQPAAQPRPAGVWQAVLASASVVVVVIAHFWEVARLSHQSALLQDLEAGNRVTLAEARASDSGLNHSVVLQLAVTVIALVFVIVWAYHARGNAAAYTTSPFRRSKGWAIGGWICPIVNLWFPFQVVKDIWSASDTDRPDSTPLRAWPVTAIVPLWWTCLIGATILQRISDSVYNNGATASSVHTALVLDFASAAIHIAAAISFILVVAAITRFQTQRHEQAVAGAQPTAQPVA